jgi:hypothetical protein
VTFKGNPAKLRQVVSSLDTLGFWFTIVPA